MSSSAPTQRHWNDIKHILLYLHETTNIGLFYPRELFNAFQLKEYVDAIHLLDSHKARLQTGYVFMCGNTLISW